MMSGSHLHAKTSIENGLGSHLVIQLITPQVRDLGMCHGHEHVQDTRKGGTRQIKKAKPVSSRVEQRAFAKTMYPEILVFRRYILVRKDGMVGIACKTANCEILPLQNPSLKSNKAMILLVEIKHQDKADWNPNRAHHAHKPHCAIHKGVYRHATTIHGPNVSIDKVEEPRIELRVVKQSTIQGNDRKYKKHKHKKVPHKNVSFKYSIVERHEFVDWDLVCDFTMPW